ncbi:MAG: 4'-phosphopantetheinyl transferase superfamily protein [Chthoniobacterales bacterium]
MEQAERYRRRQDAERFIIARACARHLCANCIGLEPRLVPILRTAFGKPYVEPTASYTLEFNVSDSGNSILIAWSMSGPVGVDVEALHPGGRASFLEMAGSFLSVAETAVLRSAKDDEIAAIFTRIWARKEAILKGEVGASGALRSLSVADENARGIRWFENTVVPNSDRTWEMHELNLAPGYAACRRCLRLAALHTSSPIAPRPKANSYPFEVPQSSVYDKCPRVSSTVGVVYHEMCPPRKRPTSPG